MLLWWSKNKSGRAPMLLLSPCPLDHSICMTVCEFSVRIHVVVMCTFVGAPQSAPTCKTPQSTRRLEPL